VPLGIVHSDISPSNVYVSKRGDVKIGDFGIARARLRRDRTEAALTGKYGYMAPEQVLGRSFDHRADLFAVGVVLAELLTGEPLFTGSSKLTVLLAVRDVRIEPLRSRMAEFPAGLMGVLLRSLSRDPGRRYLHAAEFRGALDSVIDECGPRPTAAALGLAVTRVVSVPDVASSPALERLLSGAPASEEPTIRTPTEPEGRYVFREPDDTTSEPLHFAAAVERVVTGQVGGSTLVSLEGRPFVPVEEVPELARHLPSYATAAEIERATPAETTGELDRVPVAAVLGRLVLGRDTGLVVFECSPARKEVYLADGRPEFVTSNLAGELLGEVLVSRRVLTRGELDMALAVLPRFEGHLGESLVALGLVDAVHVVRHIADQVKDKLLELFKWRRGKYTFYRGVEVPKTGFPLGLDPIEIVCEGVRTGYTLVELEEWMSRHAGLSVVLERTLPPSLPPAQRRVLESLTSATVVGEIPRRHANAEKLDVLRAILFGVEAGVLAIA
jgi:serine/threonine-protein kinase